MGSTASYYGLQPIEDVGGSIRGKAVKVTLTTNSSTGFFNGDLVHMASGVVTPVTATPTTTQNGNTPWGVFIGAEWTNNQGPQYTQFFPANGYTANSGFGPITFYILNEPDVRMKVRADGPVAYTSVGLNAQLGNFSAGSTTTGNSAVNLVSGTIANTATFGMKIIDIAPPPDNAPGDAFTDVIVVFNQNVHALRNVTGA